MKEEGILRVVVPKIVAKFWVVIILILLFTATKCKMKRNCLITSRLTSGRKSKYSLNIWFLFSMFWMSLRAWKLSWNSSVKSGSGSSLKYCFRIWDTSISLHPSFL
jgi:hypothetical protein